MATALSISAWPPGSPGRWGSPFSRPWLVDLRRHPQGMTIPKGVWLVTCRQNSGVVMQINLSLAVELVSQPDLITSTPPIVPLPMLPPIPRPPPPPCPPLPPQFPAYIKYADEFGAPSPNDRIVNHTVVGPCQTGTVWSDGWNLRLCGCGRAMLIQVSQ